MTAWMLWASVITLLAAGAAAAVEVALRLLGRPVRSAWIVAALGSMLLMVRSRLSPTPPADALAAAPGLERAAADLLRDLTANVGTAPAFLQRTDAVVGLVWLVASTILVAALGVGLWRLSRRARSWPVAIVDGREVLVSESFGPALIGILAPRIVVPRWALHLGSERLRMTCLHESEHRRRGDGLVLLGGALLTAIMPWNPGSWWIHARLRAAVEIDCDARVLRAGARPSAYGALLLELSTRALELPRMVVAFARPRATLERRVTMIVKERKKIGARGWARIAGAMTGGAMLAVVACGAPAPTEIGVEEAASATMHEVPEPIFESHESRTAQDPGVAGRLRRLAPHLEGGASTSEGTFRLREAYEDPGSPHVYVLPHSGEVSALDRQGSEHFRFRDSEGGSDGQPLIYVDGIRIGGGAQGLLEEIGPERIDRVEVIKGPAAIGLFGEEAAAGVVQVFTKEGGPR